MIDADHFLFAAPPEGVLRRGAERTIRRADMPSMRANGLSMMLEELEVAPDPQGYAFTTSSHRLE